MLPVPGIAMPSRLAAAIRIGVRAAAGDADGGRKKPCRRCAGAAIGPSGSRRLSWQREIRGGIDMGTLTAMKYPTSLFLKAADHTYVQCSSGKAWSCWGGKTGGTEFNRGTGSTKRANAIAAPNERAGITCYLVNGVCHQAANRILRPAGIIVSGARGYAVSSAMFGTYGKTGVRWLPCYAPFDQQVGVTGDLPQCKVTATRKRGAAAEALRKHLRSVQQAYVKQGVANASRLESMQFQLQLFDREVRYRLGDSVARKTQSGLRLAKEAVELRHDHLVEALRNQDLAPAEFVKAFNDMTLKFQDDVASATNDKQYKQLFELSRDERLILALPESVRAAYGEDTAVAVYGRI
jgi:hypothetical protein